MLQAVIFDIDGTLIDSVDFHARAWQETFRRFGREVPFEAVRHQIGKGGDQLMPVFLPADEVERRGEEIEAFRKELFKREYLPRVKAFPAVRELFERIRRDGQRIALASSAKGDELERYQKVAGIDDLVEAATSSEDAARSKPHPDIFQAALQGLGHVRPEEAIVLGDTPYDAMAAGKAGLRTIGLLCGGFPEDELRGAGCVAIYHDPQDLLWRYDESPLGTIEAIVGSTGKAGP
jgi:HAD superfamily hydrolase (TIGR01509 family)